MERKDVTMDHILQGVNRKLMMKGVKIAVISFAICVLLGAILYWFVFGKQMPIPADVFKDVRIETKRETIHQIDKQELEYSHLLFNINQAIFYSLESNAYFHIEKNEEDQTNSLYFYISENNMQRMQNKKIGRNQEDIEEPNYVDILLTPSLCQTKEFVSNISKIYYLVYDYQKFNQKEFNTVKNQAVLLWEQ